MRQRMASVRLIVLAVLIFSEILYGGELQYGTLASCNVKSDAGATVVFAITCATSHGSISMTSQSHDIRDVNDYGFEDPKDLCALITSKQFNKKRHTCPQQSGFDMLIWAGRFSSELCPISNGSELKRHGTLCANQRDKRSSGTNDGSTTIPE
jgi:hypothetical protein